MVTSCTNPEHSFYKPISNMEPKDRISFFTGANSVRMKQVSLGEALDFICAGAAMNAVYWAQDSKGLANFIGEWMNAQDAKECRAYHKNVPDPKIKGVYSRVETKRLYNLLWNRFDRDYDEELPHIDYKECPRDSSHKGILTQGNIVRCSHVGEQFFKPSFIYDDSLFLDEHTGLWRPSFYEREPNPNEGLPMHNDDEEDMSDELYEVLYGEQLRENQRLEKLFRNEAATERVTDPCYAIISDKGSYLPLQTILDRLNINKSMRNDNGSLFPFSGFTVASFAKAWYNQEGERRFFASEGKKDCYKVFKDYPVYSSDD